ncbi:MAG TPA: hypothetical protein VD789_09020 [Thermomicrobiales bacterium]|nr:hypothetical protein [Thermomicrobiales bacterium]
MTTPIDIAAIPAVITQYLERHLTRDEDGAINAFAPDATVVDEGRTYIGLPEIRSWLGRTSSEYTYTATVTGHEILDDWRIVVHRRLEGNFPGGIADLRSEFTLDSGLIAKLSNS